MAWQEGSCRRPYHAVLVLIKYIRFRRICVLASRSCLSSFGAPCYMCAVKIQTSSQKSVMFGTSTVARWIVVDSYHQAWKQIPFDKGIDYRGNASKTNQQVCSDCEQHFVYDVMGLIQGKSSLLLLDLLDGRATSSIASQHKLFWETEEIV